MLKIIAFSTITVLLLSVSDSKSLLKDKLDISEKSEKAADPIISILQDYFMLNGLDEVIETFLKDVFNETSQCTLELELLYNDTKNMEDWALRMLDSTAKPQSGIFSGNILHVGNYDECLKINYYFNKTINIKGRYCTALFNKDEQKQKIDNLLGDGSSLMQLRTSYGFCLPQSCKATDLQKIADNLEKLLNSPFRFYFYDEFCSSVEESTKISSLDILALSIFTLFGFLTLYSTSYDMLVTKGVNDTAKSKIYTAFSFYTNSKLLLSTQSTADSIKCLNGIKVLSLAWIISSHRYMYTLYVPLINYADILEELTSYSVAFILIGSLAVDTFLLVTGLLIVYLFLKNHAKGCQTSWMMFYVHRILRLSPSLAAMVLVYSTIFDNIGSGPFWFLIPNVFQRFCKTNWWSTLLYVQNYVNPNDICVGQSWYLAVDTHLYFLSPILLLTLTKWPALAIGGALSLVVLSDGYSFMTSHIQNLGPAFFGSEKVMFKSVYVPTHARCSPWLLGCILGYAIFKLGRKRRRLNKIWILFCWLIILGTFFGIAHVHKLLATNNEDMVIESALYNSLARTLWSLVLSGLILLCVTGNGGVINNFLSCPLFLVLSRLCYSMYLVQLLVIISSTAQIRTPEYLSHIFKVKEIFGDFVSIFLISFIWTLTFETPVIQLEKLLFKKKKPLEAVEPQICKDHNQMDTSDKIIPNKLSY